MQLNHADLNLNEQRKLAALILCGIDKHMLALQAGRLAELVEALDQHIELGGVLPTPWAMRHPEAGEKAEE